MRILFSSMRLTGHIRPLLPYMDAFLHRGHEVRAAAPEGARAILEGAGIEHAPFDHPGDERLKPIWARFRGVANEEMGAIAIGEIFANLNARAALPKLRETIRDWRPDLIVRESAEFAAAVAADEAGIPHARVATSNGYAEEKVFRHAAAPVDIIRREAGLEPDDGASLRAAPAFTSFPASLDGDAPCAGGLPPFRVRAPKDTVDPKKSPPTWALDDRLPLFFITLGTLAAGTPETHAVYRAALEAIAALPVRALLSTGAAMDPEVLGTIPANVTVEAWVPQNEVYPRASALLCHGGAGTLLAGLASGVPMVIAPLNADQPDNARRVEATGAGIAVFQAGAAALQAAMERVLADAGVARQCTPDRRGDGCDAGHGRRRRRPLAPLSPSKIPGGSSQSFSG